MGNKIKARLDKIPNSVRLVLLFFVATRIILTLTGIASRNVFNDLYRKWYEWNYDKNQWLDVWSVWDSGWYLDIAENGYSTNLSSDLPKKTCCGQSNIAFFPLYPGLIKVLGNIINNKHTAGIIISNISFIIASLYFYKMVFNEYGEPLAKKSLLFLYLFPTSYFFSALLTEGLFFLTVIASFYYSRKHDWLKAAFFGAAAALTRSVGILMLVPFAVEYFANKQKGINKTGLPFILLLIPAAAIAFMLYQYLITGNFLATFITEKNSWGHGLVNPFSYLITILFSKSQTLIYFFMLWLFEISLIIFNIKKLGPVFSIYSLTYLVFPLFSGGETIYALPRFASIVFPIYISLAFIANSRRSVSIYALILFSLQLFSMFLWSLGVFGY